MLLLQGVSFALESVLCPSPALSSSSLINTTSTIIWGMLNDYSG
ncbi:hypothetical protein Hanom_Chr07g00641841 [Helianthus anomalus]